MQWPLPVTVGPEFGPECRLTLRVPPCHQAAPEEEAWAGQRLGAAVQQSVEGRGACSLALLGWRLCLTGVWARGSWSRAGGWQPRCFPQSRVAGPLPTWTVSLSAEGRGGHVRRGRDGG